MTRTGLLLSVFLSASANSVWAAIIATPATPLERCGRDTMFSSTTPKAPARIAAVQKDIGRGVQFRVCTDQEKNIHHFLRVIRPNTAGVCRMFEREIFPAGRDNGVSPDIDIATDRELPETGDISGWKLWAPVAWLRRGYGLDRTNEMAVITSQRCDLPGLEYGIARGVSNGVLKAFDQSWQKVTSSPQTFRAAFANLLRGNDHDPAPFFLAANSEGWRLLELVAMDYRKRRVYGITCGVTVREECTAGMGTVRVGFDLTDRGVVFTRMWDMPVP